MLSILLALGYGLLSAVVPLLNAELYAAAAGRADLGPTIAVALALAAGQSAGKLALFEGARRGTRRFSREREPARWAALLHNAFERRRSAVALVLASAAVGLPPLAAVSLAAGAGGQRRWEFAVLCLTGRAARFLALALAITCA